VLALARAYVAVAVYDRELEDIEIFRSRLGQILSSGSKPSA
jgi:hypothetical protein